VRGGVELASFPDQAVSPRTRSHQFRFLAQAASLIGEALFERNGLFKASAFVHFAAPFC
jgi:hypothetical protein